MIKPSIEELTKNGKFNRYELVIATAKCAHIVTDEYVRQRAEAERKITSKENGDKPLTAMINKDLRDEKAVKNAIRMLNDGEYKIVPEGEQTVTAEPAEM